MWSGERSWVAGRAAMSDAAQGVPQNHPEGGNPGSVWAVLQAGHLPGLGVHGGAQRAPRPCAPSRSRVGSAGVRGPT